LSYSCEECGMQTGHRTGCWIGFKKLNAELAAAKAVVEAARCFVPDPETIQWDKREIALKAALAAYDALKKP
jgi:hypothetical protein